MTQATGARLDSTSAASSTSAWPIKRRVDSHLLQGDGGRRLGSCSTWIWPGVRRSAALRASGATSFGPDPWRAPVVNPAGYDPELAPGRLAAFQCGGLDFLKAFVLDGEHVDRMVSVLGRLLQEVGHLPRQSIGTRH
jgi:hypothetical protein